jgi:hypothetical protein
MKTQTIKVPASTITVGMMIYKPSDQPREVIVVRESYGKLRFTVRGTKNPEQCGCMTYGKNQPVPVCP